RPQERRSLLRLLRGRGGSGLLFHRLEAVADRFEFFLQLEQFTAEVVYFVGLAACGGDFPARFAGCFGFGRVGIIWGHEGLQRAEGASVFEGAEGADGGSTQIFFGMIEVSGDELLRRGTALVVPGADEVGETVEGAPEVAGSEAG